jgi:hypothetical protein
VALIDMRPIVPDTRMPGVVVSRSVNWVALRASICSGPMK